MSSSLSSVHGRRGEAAGFSGTRQRSTCLGLVRVPALVTTANLVTAYGRVWHFFRLSKHVSTPGSRHLRDSNWNSMDSAADSSARWLAEKRVGTRVFGSVAEDGVGFSFVVVAVAGASR